MSPEKPRRLGRGLEALIGNSSIATRTEVAAASSSANELRRLPLSVIRPNPFQPRRDFPESDLAELRASLQSSGMLQPVVVRPVGDAYELISGERRFRAAAELGWQELPALVREADERTMLTLALIENLQRSDLNVIEEARGYQRLQDDFELTHQQISTAVGKDRSTVTNLLRLLALPSNVQAMLEQGKLTMGHARALLSLPSDNAIGKLAEEITSDGLSVREAERRVRLLIKPAEPTSPSPATVPATSTASQPPSQDPAVRNIEDTLRRRLQTDVQLLVAANGNGSIRIAFYSSDDLNRLLELLIGRPRVGD